ncbi:type VI secretion system tip protein VgrG [Pseudomonas sp. zfem002]|uniref:type VI secretion system Vgr family protein n=1 Tax=Pseudomonas sp. zfem002 TaxID=3078197 RepID=UPI00292A2FF9|nr:type VI secretion system tip protein VgrG [Pseudomonas sp. zfem002]MDU9393623.1 type VI secretion system tip protein VgrG [Pseudomonas sp. zfem002]
MGSIVSRYSPPTHRNPYDLRVRDLDDKFLDVYAFEGQEYLSKPFRYTIRFTCGEPREVFNGVVSMTQEQFLARNERKNSPLDLDMPSILNRTARFAIYGKPPKVFAWRIKNEIHEPLRELFGLITGFQRIGGSVDEGHYEITLEPRLVRLARGKRYRIFQHQSVPQIVRQILEDHGFFVNSAFRFDLKREYPRRRQVMQYGESDLAFIERLLAEVGIWYRIVFVSELKVDQVRFHDWQCHLDFGVELPCLTPSGLSSSDADAVWELRTQHQVVEKEVFFRTYDPRQANLRLQGEVSRPPGFSLPEIRYGETYEYAMPYTEMGTQTMHGYGAETESGHFYARLSQERSLNQRVLLSGTTCSPTLMPGQVLRVTGNAPQDFANRVLVHTIDVKGARNKLHTVEFSGIPYDEYICFRPQLKPKPSISGTVPARITSQNDDDLYSHIDDEGRYRVRFLFDRDTWDAGKESVWLRLARPYAGATYGLHLPLVQGTEVAVAFEQGDPDRPYIAHALHDSKHPDHVALHNHKRNVLRTPANNKLRMEDERGKEHVKLSTEFGGKTQLNLGHLVDSGGSKRGEGFELRTDDWGVLRAGKGILITAEEQSKAQGIQLAMNDAIAQLNSALTLARTLAVAAQTAKLTSNDVESLDRLSTALTDLAKPGILMQAPEGIGLLSPENICLASTAESVSVVAENNTDITVGRDFTVLAREAVALLAKNADMQLKAAQGKVELFAQNNRLHALAKNDVKIESVAGRVEITAPQELVLNCGGAFIRLKDGNIELGAPGNIYLKASHVQTQGAATLATPPTQLPSGYSGIYTLNDEEGVPQPFARYRITTQQGEVFDGITNKEGKTVSVNTAMPGGMKLEPVEDEGWISYSMPEGLDYRGVKCRLILQDGTVMEDEFDQEGKAAFYLKEDMRVERFEWGEAEKEAEVPSLLLNMLGVKGGER